MPKPSVAQHAEADDQQQREADLVVRRRLTDRRPPRRSWHADADRMNSAALGSESPWMPRTAPSSCVRSARSELDLLARERPAIHLS
jgi:hypothetical protein